MNKDHTVALAGSKCHNCEIYQRSASFGFGSIFGNPRKKEKWNRMTREFFAEV